MLYTVRKERKTAMTEINQAFVDGVMPRRDPEAKKNDIGRVLCV